MKHVREIKVALLAIVCGFLLYFGMYFLRGMNLFSPTRTYVGVFERINGLTEQAPVFVRGYNVGQVNRIEYDFSRRNAFHVSVAIDKHIAVPEGAEMVLVADGIMGGKAIELIIPVSEGQVMALVQGYEVRVQGEKFPRREKDGGYRLQLGGKLVEPHLGFAGCRKTQRTVKARIVKVERQSTVLAPLLSAGKAAQPVGAKNID